MSKNNNERNQNNSNNRKNTRGPKVNPNEIKVPLYLPADLNTTNIANEIVEVLENTKFNKISIPLGTYRCLVDSTVDKNDTRISTIGYIRNYNAETEEFTVIVFDKYIDVIKELGCIAMELLFTQYKESLGTITKFNIISIDSAEDDCDDEVDE